MRRFYYTGENVLANDRGEENNMPDTLRDKLAKYLTDHGLWPKEAEEVIDTYRDSEAYPEDQRWRFEDVAEGYPPQVLSVMILAVRSEAVRWIDANKPKHFARLMFVE